VVLVVVLVIVAQQAQVFLAKEIAAVRLAFPPMRFLVVVEVALVRQGLLAQLLQEAMEVLVLHLQLQVLLLLMLAVEVAHNIAELP
jgi:primosomal protein N'